VYKALSIVELCLVDVRAEGISYTAVSLKKILLDRIFCWKALFESSNAAKLLF